MTNDLTQRQKSDKIAGKFMPEKLPPTMERGKQFADLLQSASIKTFDSRVKTDPAFLNQIPDGPWDKFVTFPDIPISSTYIPLYSFLNDLGKSDNNIQALEGVLISERLGEFTKPVFDFKEDNFRLRVINGMMNIHSLTMTEMASHGFEFDDPFDRAEYQTAMQQLAMPIVRSEYDTTTFGVRIFDDCIASADSIYGYLFSQLQDPVGETKIKRGVRVDAITATPQAILFLKKFAEVMGFPLEINVAQLAPGLNEKNYIVYPEEFLLTGPLADDYYEKLSGWESKDGNTYTVGDMGNAQKGLSEEEMAEIARIYGPDYLPFNNSRTDPHGNHVNKGNKVDTTIPGRLLPEADFVFFARGGYLPFQFDRSYNEAALQRANIIVLRASRKEVGGQYGVAFGPEKE